ncbi:MULTISPECIES: GNAT family protein [unclassified Devosia]|uniref:GNAT family N-acetyltransferase n=1 Tax=unclassified Devosia TaxID=196773 RepID=UPI0018F0B319|nr:MULTISPECIES: GNAT family protein [unclassified Devosia]
MSTLRFPIETAHLILRPFERADVKAVSRYHALPTLARYLERPSRYAGDEADAVELMRKQTDLVRPGDVLTLALCRKGDERLIGQVSLRWYDAMARQGEMTFAIEPTMSGQGYLTQALSTMFELGFDHFNMHRIVVRSDARSHNTVKLLQKLGMRLEAHYREHALYQGDWDEEMHFALLDRDWRPATKIVQLPVRGRVA